MKSQKTDNKNFPTTVFYWDQLLLKRLGNRRERGKGERPHYFEFRTRVPEGSGNKGDTNLRRQKEEGGKRER